MSAGACRPTIRIDQIDQLSARRLLGARRHGLAADALLAQAGIAPALLSSSLAKVTQQQYATLARLLRRRLRDDSGVCARSRCRRAAMPSRCTSRGAAPELIVSANRSARSRHGQAARRCLDSAGYRRRATRRHLPWRHQHVRAPPPVRMTAAQAGVVQRQDRPAEAVLDRALDAVQRCHLGHDVQLARARSSLSTT
jgi:biotin synthase-related radical SAM superfamily protein